MKWHYFGYHIFLNSFPCIILIGFYQLHAANLHHSSPGKGGKAKEIKLHLILNLEYSNSTSLFRSSQEFYLSISRIQEFYIISSPGFWQFWSLDFCDICGNQAIKKTSVNRIVNCSSVCTSSCLICIVFSFALNYFVNWQNYIWHICVLIWHLHCSCAIIVVGQSLYLS